MFETVFSFIREFISHIRFADFVDIIIVTAFLYTFITWMRRSASRRLMISISIFAAVYFLSRFFDLYLTEILIKVLIIVVLIASVVIFQADIRRMVDMIGMWVLLRHKPKVNDPSRTIDILTEASSNLASKRTGALIAIRGNEPWEKPIHGGIDLNGKVSEILLYSIFNTSSPGHDGAVLIEGDKILKFGAHLTLSTNLKAVGKGGTRHAAGLGLAEQCDAFVIIVSEERGTISFARNGVIKILESGSELKEELENFWAECYSEQNAPLIGWWKKSGIVTALISVIIAVVSWFLFAYQSEMVFRTFTVPIEYRNLQAKIGLVGNTPNNVRVILSGSEQAFRLLDPTTLAVSIGLGKLEPGKNEIVISEDNLDIPSNIQLYEVEPRILHVTAQDFKNRCSSNTSENYRKTSLKFKIRKYIC